MNTAIRQNIFERLFECKLHLVFVIQLLHPLVKLILNRIPHKTVSILLKLYILFFFFQTDSIRIRTHGILRLDVLDLNVNTISLVPHV